MKMTIQTRLNIQLLYSAFFLICYVLFQSKTTPASAKSKSNANTSSSKKKKKSDEVVEGGGTDLFATLVPEDDPEDDAEPDPPRTPDVKRFIDTEAKEGRDVEPKAKAKSTKPKKELVIVGDETNSQPAPDVVAHEEVATIEVKRIYIYIYFFV